MAKKPSDFGDRLLAFIRDHPQLSSAQIHERAGLEISYASLKRQLENLVSLHLVTTSGNGRSTKYLLAPSYELLRPVDVEEYFTKEIDDRKIRESYNPSLTTQILPEAAVFTEEELEYLAALQREYQSNISRLPEEEYKKELERLAIDLSWKSSQIEGNTYSLLETERLLRDRETAAGKSKEEASMLLNHKEALDFVIANPGYLDPLRVAAIEDVHSILVKELNVARNLRRHRVGISGTNYRPLDNEFQIKEALEETCTLINGKTNVFEKALLALVLLSYIQPFSDGNKRTARIVSNALLINHSHCPVSFRTVDAIDYKKAMLLFYEQNNIAAVKKIFIEQFAFAVKTYF